MDFDAMSYLMNGIDNPEELFRKLAATVGSEICDNTIRVSFHFESDTERREMALKLRQLRSNVVDAVQRFNANVTGLLAEFQLTSEQKQVLRKAQLDIRNMYNLVKANIDRVLIEPALRKPSK